MKILINMLGYISHRKRQFILLSLFPPAMLHASLPGPAPITQGCNQNMPLTRPDSRYETVLGATPADSEVRDKVTGLIWKRCLEGMSWTGTNCTGSPSILYWQDALSAAKNATITTSIPATSWRVPNQNELLSLLELACYKPALNINWFPGVPLSSFNGSGLVWSSTPSSAQTNTAWYVGFMNGYDGYSSKTGGITVRLVRSSR